MGYDQEEDPDYTSSKDDTEDDVDDSNSSEEDPESEDVMDEDVEDLALDLARQMVIPPDDSVILLDEDENVSEDEPVDEPVDEPDGPSIVDL